jgi:hypothetical protein
MKRLVIALVVLFMVSLAFSTYVNADWDKDDVAKLVEKVKKGQGFDDFNYVESSMVQVVRIGIGHISYTIDIKAQICYAGLPVSNGGGVVIVPCAKVKKAYPLFAPLITWEK